MIKKVISIFLSLIFTISCTAKPAPQNTFRLENSGNQTNSQISAASLKRKEIFELKEKLRKMNLEKKGNFVFDKVRDFRISRIKSKIRELENQ